MKNTIIIFKLVNHDKMTTHKICYHVYCFGEVDQWSIKQDNSAQHHDHVIKRIQWLHNLKEKLKTFLAEHYNNISNNNFENFRFIKEKCFKNTENVNITDRSDGTNDFTIKRTKHMERITMKFSKGEKPKSCNKLYSYKKQENHYFIKTNFSNNVLNLQVIQPDNNGISISDNTSNSFHNNLPQSQSGGNNMYKYIYKNDIY